MRPNYAFKPIAEQDLRSNHTFVPQRLNAALGLMIRTVVKFVKWLFEPDPDAAEKAGKQSIAFPPETKLVSMPEFLVPELVFGVEVLNNDTAPMEFVVRMLMTELAIPKEKAVGLMLQIHKKGGIIIQTSSKSEAESAVLGISKKCAEEGRTLTVRVADLMIKE